MKRVRLNTWACQLQPPRNPRLPQRRYKSQRPTPRQTVNERIAKLAALHARLSLPPKLPLPTLARCLIDASANPNPEQNNASLAVLGKDLLAYHTSEHLIVNYPRLPMAIIFAAQYAYSGPEVLSAMRAEWGVELAAAPGIEVDQALLQFRRVIPGKALAEDGLSQVWDTPPSQKSFGNRRPDVRRGMSSRIVYDDEFGEIRSDIRPYPGSPISTRNKQDEEGTQGLKNGSGSKAISASSQASDEAVTAELASATFIRALTGALYLHVGDEAVKAFHQDHFMSRHLELHKLFHFNVAPRDLNRLCQREGFEAPVARLLSETGRLSRTPVFVVGVYSGDDKLGEAAGASLHEARFRAASAALRSWYLYSPPQDDIMLPSDTSGKKWKAQMIDPGEIVS